jgi:ABC-type dipeptide/oligopeptide/nickel transport system ATPase component
MEVYALVGSSGTGKSHQAMHVAHAHGIQCVVDDGLLIGNSKRLAGRSAKREDTKMAAVKRAIFFHHDHRQEVRDEIERLKPESIMILGTSDRMIENIAESLGLHGVDYWIRIEDVSTPEDMQMARDQREKYGKHIIPLPTVEVKRDFSGYFLDAMKTIVRRRDQSTLIGEKTVVRPTFSYLGKFSVSNRVLAQIAHYAAEENELVVSADKIRVIEMGDGLEIHAELELRFPYHILKTAEEVQKRVAESVEDMTRIQVLRVLLYVKSLG